MVSDAGDETVYRLDFPDMADFHITPTRITAQTAPGTPQETVVHLLVDQALPRWLWMLGQQPLHAGGVEIRGRAVLFTGHSGWGKSTLAAEFHHAGHVSISDDVVFVERCDDSFWAVQSYPGFRLWTDSIGRYPFQHVAPMTHYSVKQRVIMTDSSSPVPLSAPIACIFALAPPEALASEIRIVRLTPAQAFWHVTQQSFRLMPADAARVQREFALFSDFAARVPFYSLSYPRTFAALPGVVRAVVDHLSVI